MIIPYEQLSSEALRGVIEDVVTRSGTELSDADEKVKQVLRHLKAGKLVITYNPKDSTCNIVSANAVVEEDGDEAS